MLHVSFSKIKKLLNCEDDCEELIREYSGTMVEIPRLPP